MRMFERIGIAATTIGLLLVLIVGVGLWQNWFEFSASTDRGPQQDEMKMKVTINKDEMREDAERAEDEAARLKQSVQAFRDLETIDGNISRVDSASDTLTINTDDGDIAVVVDENTEIVRDDDDVPLTDLEPAERVTVTYRQGDEVNQAQKVTVQN